MGNRLLEHAGVDAKLVLLANTLTWLVCFRRAGIDENWRDAPNWNNGELWRCTHAGDLWAPPGVDWGDHAVNVPGLQR